MPSRRLFAARARWSVSLGTCAVTWVLMLLADVLAGCQAQIPLEEQARAIEGDLIAPCCFNQTLDIHKSPVAEQMRAEIRSRLGQGQSHEEILAGLVARHGPRVRAVPAGFSKARLATVLLLLSLGLGGGVVVVLARKWSRGTAGGAAPKGSAAAAAAAMGGGTAGAGLGTGGASEAARTEAADLEEQLEAELRDLD